jgi:hypothetical protein
MLVYIVIGQTTGLVRQAGQHFRNPANNASINLATNYFGLLCVRHLRGNSSDTQNYVLLLCDGLHMISTRIRSSYSANGRPLRVPSMRRIT